MRRLAILTAALVLAAAAVSGRGFLVSVTRTNGSGGSNAKPLGGVRAEKSNHALGESVKLTFTIENRTGQKMTLRFPSGQLYDIWIKKNGAEIWRWSYGKAFTQAITSRALDPGEKMTFTEAWRQVTNTGDQVPPGAYTIFAQLTTFPPRPTLVKTEITIGKSKAVVQPVTVSTIVNNVDAAVGQLVQITGTYMGWRPDPKAPACKPGPPVTRSDWAVSDETGCIFVTGRSGLDPISDIGKKISVSGTVKKTEKGQPYVEARNVITEAQ
ncbi:MAG: hypothetical protein HYX78_10170 [Armatimonadetes bacterium]|nr:hypothetical protein [Armatimonadota bacterium]